MPAAGMVFLSFPIVSCGSQFFGSYFVNSPEKSYRYKLVVCSFRW